VRPFPDNASAAPNGSPWYGQFPASWKLSSTTPLLRTPTRSCCVGEIANPSCVPPSHTSFRFSTNFFLTDAKICHGPLEGPVQPVRVGGAHSALPRWLSTSRATNVFNGSAARINKAPNQRRNPHPLGQSRPLTVGRAPSPNWLGPVGEQGDRRRPARVAPFPPGQPGVAPRPGGGRRPDPGQHEKPPARCRPQSNAQTRWPPPPRGGRGFQNRRAKRSIIPPCFSRRASPSKTKKLQFVISIRQSPSAGRPLALAADSGGPANFFPPTSLPPPQSQRSPRVSPAPLFQRPRW